MAISSWPPVAIPWKADLSPCISLYPTLPKDVCVTALSMTMSGVSGGGTGVGGISELSGVLSTGSGKPGARLMLMIAGLGVALAAGAMVLIRRRLAS